MKLIKLIIILLFIFSMTVFSTKNDLNKTDSNGLINKITWIAGLWQYNSGKAMIYESWSRKSDFEFLGFSYYLKEGDTTIMETMELKQEGETLYYIPTVKGQNNGQPVSFTLIALSDDIMTFENQDHDFPKVISYQHIYPDSLVAEISGELNGTNKSMIFPMKRIR